jgi:sterol desaturase/sphingolipid hydroxylase (fatty acid hydroxylase superfamily)
MSLFDKSAFSELGLIGYAIPLYTVVILVEMYLSHADGRKAYTVKDTLTNIYLTLLNMIVDAGMRLLVVLTVLNFVFSHKLFSISNPIAYWVVLTIAEDFIFYWIHRLEHSSRFFWAVHVTHHSSEHFNLTTGFRSSVFQPVYRFLFFLPLAWCGFSPADIAFVFSATQIYGILVHTQYVKNIPVWEWVFVTPAHHQVHHASNIRYLDKNIGMLLIIWDRMFGTFQPQLDSEPVVYGLHKKADMTGPSKIFLHEWTSIWADWKTKKHLPFRTRLNYLFKAPGWSHDGSSKTAQEYRDELGY